MSKKTILILSIVLLVAAAGGVAYWLFKKPKEDDDDKMDIQPIDTEIQTANFRASSSLVRDGILQGEALQTR